MTFKWQRKDDCWHLWRVYQIDGGGTLEQETGYIVRRARRAAWVTKPGNGEYWWAGGVRDAKDEAERLCANT